jgi:hypothetical protein
MIFLSIVSLTLFCVIVCVVEIPKMMKAQLYRELYIFSVLLACGLVIGILKSLDLDVPNPSDWIATIYSPFAGLMKLFLK